MTEASYTAWDDKQYVWPPPDGWYEASDGKWWPEGYGPPQEQEASPSAAVAETSAATDLGTTSATTNGADAGWQSTDELGSAAGVVNDQAAARGAAVDETAPVSALADAAESATSEASGWASDGPGLGAAAGAAGAGAAGAGAVGDGAVGDGLAGFSDATDRVEDAATQVYGGAENGAADAASAVTGDANGLAAAGTADLTSGAADLASDLGAEASNMASGLGADASNMASGLGAEASGLAAGVAADAGTDVAGVMPDGDNLAGSLPGRDEVADVAETTVIGGVPGAAPAMEQMGAESAPTVIGSDGFDAASSAANQAFGTGLMPPMADRPAGAPDGPPTDGAPGPGFDRQFDAAAGQADLSGQPPADFDALAAAAPVTSPPAYDPAREQQAILDAQPKGSSRGLLFAILGVVALLVIGAALFFALGGDGDSGGATETAITTGPGSVSEPHPRATGVVVFYPDGDVEQRWIIEVLEPIGDVSDEFENDGTQMLAATRIRVTNDSGADGATLQDLRFNLVDAANQVIVRTDNSCPPGVDDFAYSAAVAVADSVEGTVCWAIPSGDLAGMKLGIESSKVQGRVHIQLQ